MSMSLQKGNWGMVHNSQPGRMKVHLTIERRLLFPFKLWLNEAENDVNNAAVFFARTGRLTTRLIGGLSFCCYLIFKHRSTAHYELNIITPKNRPLDKSSLSWKRIFCNTCKLTWGNVTVRNRTEGTTGPQAVQAPAVRWSSWEIRVITKL